MKKLKKQTLCSLFACLLIIKLSSAVMAQSPEENREKYQIYRERFKTEFLYNSGDASIQGSYIPMESLRTSESGQKSGYWADGVWWLGHYVAMLSIEYRLQQLDNVNTDETLQELRHVIATYNRLDLEAERCWGGNDSLNGFFLRDDIDNSLASTLNVKTINSDYKKYCGKGLEKNAPSQDQLWASYVGFALLLKLVDVPDLQAEVKQLTSRLISSMHHTTPEGKEVWEIVNPVTGNVVQKQMDIQWLQYAHQQVETSLTDNKNSWGKANTQFWKDMWTMVKNNMLINKNGNFVWYGVLSCATVINDNETNRHNGYDWLVKRCGQIQKKRPDLQQTLIFPHFPLISAILHGYQGKNPIPAAQYEQYLDAAPQEGAFHYVTNDTNYSSPAPWHSLSLFCPWHTADVGSFNMLDYLLLYNAYRLVYRSGLEEYMRFTESPDKN
ncbi:MAG: hypothetical protein LBV46_02170 [Bacteroidales bacterium]|nr:hypothetical protein [Bacteroidales bacterium]